MDGVALAGFAAAVLLLPRSTRLSPAQDRLWCRRIAFAGVILAPLLILLSLKG